ncbi:hypothetical protein DFQ11_103167 [Winogradskyella epiphytica]|uniref:Uncharacterized protein n=1 Tax=Winogradskyella epiphytica TaxID=262005 RepID=A0A2V4YD00_9FLAO|nr:hypothetical protein [Winogradskyella epiphytica]PYE81087.1 hypothetical protein DFQ11_103167 [Winogradskyella epiphytica]GGW66771.1 hypothetical protein GCM10008085_18300 [Winogradskyella epiphytica]
MKKENLNNITSPGFKTPDQYFESFEDKLFARLYKKVSMHGVESSGYTVPKDYFNSVEEAVFNKTKTEDRPVIQLKQKKILYYVAGIAASLVLFFSLFFNQSNEFSMASLDSIDTSSIESYLYQEEYSTDELATLFKSGDMSVSDFIDVTITEETINNYLDNLDTEDLILD